MASRGRGRRGRPRDIGQAPSAFDQQAFAEAIGIVVAAITHACAIVSQGGSNDLHRLEVHNSPLGREGGVDDIRGIRDLGAGSKRKEYPFSSNPGKKQKTSVTQGYPRQGQGYQDQD